MITQSLQTRGWNIQTFSRMCLATNKSVENSVLHEY
jgi:hypothetical protein